MGDELREVATRFTYESDGAGVRRVNRTIVGIRRNLIALGGILGVTFSGKALTELGLAAEQTEERLRGALGVFSGDAKDRIVSSIKEIQAEFNELKKGAGEIITPAEGKLIAERFFSEFEDTSEEGIDRFQTFLRSALAESLRTGDKVGNVFEKMLEGAKAGSIEAIRGLAGVTAESILLFEFMTSLGSGIDPTGSAQLRRNMEAFIKLLEDSRPEVDAFVRGISDPLITFRTTGTEAREAFQGLGGSIVKSMTPALQVIRDIFSDINKGIPVVDALGNAFENAAKKAAGVGPADADSAAKDLGGIATVTITPLGKFLGLGDEDEEPKPRVDLAERLKAAGVEDPRALIMQAFGKRDNSDQPRDRNLNITMTVDGEVRTVTGKEDVLDAVGEHIDQVTEEFPITETP